MFHIYGAIAIGMFINLPFIINYIIIILAAFSCSRLMFFTTVYVQRNSYRTSYKLAASKFIYQGKCKSLLVYNVCPKCTVIYEWIFISTWTKNVGISNKKLCINEHSYCVRNNHTVKHSIILDNPFLIASYPYYRPQACCLNLQGLTSLRSIRV